LSAPIELYYAVRRLKVRDELVLKSIVRILHGQTRHNWLYSPELTADLVIVGPAREVDDCPDSALVNCLIMSVGRSELSHQNSTVDLRVGDVLSRLNELGDQIVASRSNHRVAAAAQQQHDSSRDERYALVRWPDWALMQEDRSYLRIATVLAARPVGLRELANKADAEVALCVEFLRKLHERNLLRASMPVPELALAPPPQSMQSQTAPAPQNAARDGSLWSRIRSRLGIVRESRAS
jgi:hypothetical protein